MQKKTASLQCLWIKLLKLLSVLQKRKGVACSVPWNLASWSKNVGRTFTRAVNNTGNKLYSVRRVHDSKSGVWLFLPCCCARCCCWSYCCCTNNVSVTTILRVRHALYTEPRTWFSDVHTFMGGKQKMNPPITSVRFARQRRWAQLTQSLDLAGAVGTLELLPLSA